MSISMPVTLAFTAAASKEQVLAVEAAFRSAGFQAIRREIYGAPANAKIPLASPTFEVTTDRSIIDDHLRDLATGLSAARRDAPELGVMLVLVRAGGQSVYSWRRHASAEDVAAGVAALDTRQEDHGAYGWDSGAHTWIRV